MKGFMQKFIPTKRFVIGAVLLVLMIGSVGLAWPLSAYLEILFGVAFIAWLSLCLFIKYEYPVSDKEEAKKQRMLKYYEEQQAIRKRIQEINEKQKIAVANSDVKKRHFYTKVAGVTYNNDDSGSRQYLLEEMLADNSDVVQLERKDFEGELAIEVRNRAEVIGNIPREDVDDVDDIFDQILITMCKVDSFINDEGKEIYFAKLDIIYEV